ncbi:translation initiation factor eIF 4e-like domain-containing protein [Lentinula lateritia]|uniref:Translation initiation factor eIF 4e-like domain-containing protein n=1 Tax=Lentinula lateritia TaxID=40482 RepID=A0ABQ8VFU0_9AGAR|nr:translation initiation factor eIF 4e-like domain-containing protein [Lentinula lateritia]
MDMGEPMDIDEMSPVLMRQLGRLRLNDADNISTREERPRLEDHRDVEDSTSSFTPYPPQIFSPSSPAPHITTTDGWITAHFNESTATLLNVERFTQYWRPNFSLSHGQNQSQSSNVNFVLPTTQWIAINRGSSSPSSKPRIPELKAAFDALASGHRTNGHLTLTVSTLDELAFQYHVLSGKWMIFANRDTIDALWRDVVQMVCMYRKRGTAKVSVNEDDRNNRVICVYVENFADFKEVRGLREDLRTVVGVKKKIPFKMDAYTHMGIYRDNRWGIPPTRWLE